ncbi:MAG: hypothetical protein HYV07_02615 [Deltaproteobacteria bacterium]|nr:hypothetical protein [Deltaproteobacteria bacterium]
MSRTTFSHLSQAAKLAKSLVEKSDINSDGAIRQGDLTKIAAESSTAAMDAYVGLLDQLRKTAAKAGGPSKSNVKKAVDTAVKKLKARDKDGSGAIEDVEGQKRMTALEARMLTFAQKAKGKKATSFDFPETYVARPPRFSWRGTPAEVAVSLLNAYSKPANDNMFPTWVSTEPGQPRALRFVVNGTEAKSMVAALKKLYVSRQKSVMEELASRSANSSYGCLSPTNTGKKVLEAYASELGLELTFGQPAAPHFHVS